MRRRVLGLTSNHAVAYAVKACDVDVIAAYPITPQTTIVEKLAEFVANGELDAEFINVESEHSALSAVLGAAATGARTFTATSSQGFALMHEVLHNVAGLRLPVVMALPTRALSAPISIHNDYSDLMSGKDAGWIIFICSSAQEVYDTVIQAFSVSENQNVLLPSIVAYDGFLMSHTMERVEIFPDEDVISFVPHRNPAFLKEPVTLGELALPEHYFKYKYEQWDSMMKAKEVIAETHKSFYEFSGRKYDFVQEYHMDSAHFAIVGYGGVSWGNAVEAVRILREKGKKVGALRIRVLRPFPADEIFQYLKDVEAFCVVDRAISFGGVLPGPVASEVLAALSSKGITKRYISAIAGIGQKPMFVKDFLDLFEALEKGEEGVKFL